MEVFSEVDGMVLKEDEVPRQTQGVFHFTSNVADNGVRILSFCMQAPILLQSRWSAL